MARDSVELTLRPHVLIAARAAAGELGSSLSRYADEALVMRLRREGAAAMREFWSTDEGRELRAELERGELEVAGMFDELDAGEDAA